MVRSKDVTAYIAGFPAPARAALTRVRGIIRRAVPAAEEMISYQIPAYKLHGRPVLFFAAWKEHYSLYPSNARLVAAFKDQLSQYEISKGTIRFPLSDGVPATLIERIARFRARQVMESVEGEGRRTQKTLTAPSSLLYRDDDHVRRFAADEAFASCGTPRPMNCASPRAQVVFAGFPSIARDICEGPSAMTT